jgi:hypothetical protein
MKQRWDSSPERIKAIDKLEEVLLNTQSFLCFQRIHAPKMMSEFALLYNITHGSISLLHHLSKEASEGWGKGQ